MHGGGTYVLATTATDSVRTYTYFHWLQHLQHTWRFTFHLALDGGNTTSGCKSSKRALCRTCHEVPEKQVDLFRRVQLGITRWACCRHLGITPWASCRKELGHTNPAWETMHARARLGISYLLNVL